MLTDIFADRYLKRPIWEQYTEVEGKLLTQCFKIVAEQIFPYWINGKESATAKEKWTSLHNRLSMELGIDELGPQCYSYKATLMGNQHTQVRFWTMDQVCKDFVCAPYNGNVSPDRFIKERLSLVELAFRLREEELQKLTDELPAKLARARVLDKQLKQLKQGLRLPGNQADGLKAFNESLNASFRSSVVELNERFRRAGVSLNYHNGFIRSQMTR